MHDIVLDDSFELEKSFGYILSIQVSLDGFSFSIISPEEKKLMASHYNPLMISDSNLIARRFAEWASGLEILKNPYKKINVIVFSDHFTLIPEKFNSKKLNRLVSPLLFEEDSRLEVAENYIDSMKSRLVYALPKGLNKAIREQFGDCEILHPVKVTGKHISEMAAEKSLSLLFDIKSLYILLYSDNKIQLANSFRIAHTNDVIFYVLSVVKQFEKETWKIPVNCAGKIMNHKETIRQLEKYFNSVKLLQSENMISFSKEMLRQPVHQDLTLFA